MQILEVYMLAVMGLMFTLGPVKSFNEFQGKIPNGHRVPHPCKPNYIWQGVGHKNSQGGGAKNPFGMDFFDHKKVWNTALCNKDSDGDGRTNGEELGDSNCTWTAGNKGTLPDPSGHPGVCEPTNSFTCMGKNQWEFCTDIELQCEHIAGNDVKNITIANPSTAVPSLETNYWCNDFIAPNESSYHLIAYKPHIVNRHVMHHILLFGCTGEFRPTVPQSCGMGNGGNCRQLIAIWGLGSPGHCLPEQAGILFGNESFTFFRMQVHWNNPKLKTDYRDSSGLILYYTEKLRPNNAGTTIVAQSDLAITPDAPATYTAKCSSQCTEKALEQPIYIITSLLHMHYLGKSGKLIHTRNGSMIDTLFNEGAYSYDNPQLIRNENPEQFRPGDELHLTCDFNPSGNGKTVRYGDATSDEMCIGFVTYYPIQAGFGCGNVGTRDTCAERNAGFDLTKDGCKVWHFVNTTAWAIGSRGTILPTSKDRELYPKFQHFLKTCDASCSTPCMGLIREMNGVTTCISSHIAREYLVYGFKGKYIPADVKRAASHILQTLMKCDPPQAPSTTPVVTTPVVTTVRSTSAGYIVAGSSLLLVHSLMMTL